MGKAFLGGKFSITVTGPKESSRRYLPIAPPSAYTLEHDPSLLYRSPDKEQRAMPLDADRLDSLLALVRRQYPDWDHFSHAPFVRDEIAYKRQAAARAQEELGRDAFAALLDAGDYDALRRRFRAAATNLLYLATPRTGDLRLLEDERADPAALYPALFDLLHGPGESPERLDAFVALGQARDWPIYWTLPTYYLFLLDPSRDILIKPTVTRWFLANYAGQTDFPRQPDGAAYAAARAAYRDVLEALRPRGATDLIDAQSVVYVAHKAARDQKKGERSAEEELAPPFKAIFGDRATADWAFDLLAQTVRRLGGWEDDPRFALTLGRGRASLRLNLGNWMVMDISTRSGTLGLTALVEPMEQSYPFPRGAPFARSEGAMAVFTIPLDTAKAWPDELRRIYEESTLALAERFGSYGASPYRRAHRVELFRALFDEAERERLLIDGLPAAEKGERDAPGPAGPRALRESHPQWTAGRPATRNYDRDDFLRETYLTEETADELRDLSLEQRQIILYGPPGTGKTFVARRLGRWLTGLADPPPERLTVIQFHPAYSYEEFIEGIRPESHEQGGRHYVDYPSRPGVFVRFCRRAAQVDGPCVFIIDEINRGNIARIFGELMLLLEYRDEAVPLPYSGERFRIPPNVYLIGTMNTADRSIALVDFALRRRFHFFRFAADPDLFDRWLARNPPALPYLGALYRRLATEAIDDPNYAIGPGYFMRELGEAGLARLWRRSIMPYLEEYYIDQPARSRLWEWEGELVRSFRGLQDGH